MNKKMMTGALLSVLVLASAATVFASAEEPTQPCECPMTQLTEEQRELLRESMQNIMQEFREDMQEFKSSGASREEIMEAMMSKREEVRQQKLGLLEGMGIDVDELPFGLGNCGNGEMFMRGSGMHMMHKGLGKGLGNGFGMKLGQA